MATAPHLAAIQGNHLDDHTKSPILRIRLGSQVITTSPDPWELAYESGTSYQLRNISGSDASEVEIFAIEVIIGYGNADPVKVASIPDGEHHPLDLRPIWGTVTPQLRIAWTAEGSRQEFTIDLSPT